MEDVVEKLEKSGKDVQLVIFPGEGHGWRKVSSIKESFEKELEFFNRVLHLENTL